MGEPLSIAAAAAAAAATAAAAAIGHRCGEKIADGLEAAWDDGWHRDHEAGGISSLGDQQDDADMETA